jgi:hypothetical protein
MTHADQGQDNHLDNGKDEWLQGGPQSDVNAHRSSSASEILGPSLRHFPTDGDKQTSGSSESDIGFSETELEDQNIAYSRMLLAQFHPARVYARNDAGTETESQRDEALQSSLEQADEFNDTGAGED